MSKATKAGDEAALKRLGGGRWQTRDERFTIEPQSGIWVVVDANQTDDLGLPLVRGPFGSLTAAKAAIAGAREAEPEVSSLAAKVAEHRDRPPAKPPVAKRPPVKAAAPARPVPPPEPGPPPEPAWIRALPPAGRKRAHDLIERLTEAGVPEPEQLARREVVDGEPAVAAYAVVQGGRGVGLRRPAGGRCEAPGGWPGAPTLGFAGASSTAMDARSAWR